MAVNSGRVRFGNGLATNRYKIVQPEQKAGSSGAGARASRIQELPASARKIADRMLLNLSEQLDPPFLGQKSTTAPARAKILGKLAGTEEIDVAGAGVGKDLYRRGQDDKRLSAEIEELEKQIEEFGWIEELAERIAELEQLLAGIKERQKLLAALEKSEASCWD